MTDTIDSKAQESAPGALVTLFELDLSKWGGGVLYFSRLIKKSAESQLNRVVAMPVYRQMTIRNWNTTTRLLEIMEGERGRAT